MSTFEVIVTRITVEPHPNADRLDLAKIGDYRSVIGKGQFQSGDLVAYIPEGSVLPDKLISEMNLTGKLAGSQKNRVKAVSLRGILSQGLCYPAYPEWVEGQDVSDILGITKYVPPVPACMTGEVWVAGLLRTIRYDIENFKRYPNILIEGQDVVFTEKIHGTWCMIGIMPEQVYDPIEEDIVISSKGLASKGLAFKRNAANANNLYCRAAEVYQIPEKIRSAFSDAIYIHRVPVFVLGEIYGAGCQDLSYGANIGQDEQIGFRVFDIYVGIPGQGHYLDDELLDHMCVKMGLARVPVLYRGPFSREIMLDYTDGRETISGNELHTREGIVIRPVIEEYDDQIGRVQLKSVSADYLMRKGGTEFN